MVAIHSILFVFLSLLLIVLVSLTGKNLAEFYFVNVLFFVAIVTF